MKKMIMFSMLFVGLISHADTLEVTVLAKITTRSQLVVGYLSTDKSLLKKLVCNKYSLEDSKFKPKLTDISFPGVVTETGLVFSAPDKIKQCDSVRKTMPVIEVALEGSYYPSETGFKTGAVSFENSENSMANEVQTIQCKNYQTTKGLVTSCESKAVFIGPDNKATVQIIEE